MMKTMIIIMMVIMMMMMFAVMMMREEAPMPVFPAVPSTIRPFPGTKAPANENKNIMKPC
jgi:hypothetical protein